MNSYAPDSLFGFFCCPCRHESAFALVSLHRTKAGAWRAMHKAKFEAWQEAQRQHRQLTRKDIRMLDCYSDNSVTRKERGWRMVDDSVLYKIAPCPVLD